MLISFVFFYFISDFSVNRTEGFLLFSALILFLIFIVKIRDDEEVEEIKMSTASNSKILILIVISSILLYYGSELFVNSSIYFAEYFGVSERVIGLTLVAIGTSLPELVTSLVAIYKSELDISIGNIIGSNIFNILFVLATIALVTPIQTSDVTFELLLGVGFLLSLMFFIYLSKGLNKITASMLFLGYITFLYLQFYGWV